MIAAENGGDLVYAWARCVYPNCDYSEEGCAQAKSEYYSNKCNDYDRNMRLLYEKHLKVVKSCETYEDGCFVDGIETYFKRSQAIVLSSGAVVGFQCGDRGDFNYEFDSTYRLYVDTNGKKGPNKVGRDRFQIMFLKNGTLSPHEHHAGSQWATYDHIKNNLCKDDLSSTTSVCGLRILNNDYGTAY